MNSSQNQEVPKPKAPTRLAGKFVRYVLGFGVWVAIGLSPFLGRVNLPLFDSLLTLYPQSLHWVIPISGLLMGLLGMMVEFAADRRTEAPSLHRWFRWSLASSLGCLVLLVVLYPWWVTGVSYGQGQKAYFVTAGSLPASMAPDCECSPGMLPEACIQEISFNPVNINTCFGPRRVLLRGQVLVFIYLLLTGSFAACGGILVLLAQRRGD